MKMCLTFLSCLLFCSVVAGQEPTADAAAEATTKTAPAAAQAQVEAAATAQVQPVADAAASQEAEVKPTPEPAATETPSEAAVAEPTQVAPVAEPAPLVDPLTTGEIMIAPSADSISTDCVCGDNIAQTSFESQEVQSVESCPTQNYRQAIKWQPGSLLRRVFRR